jgi:hypothetical protein
MGMNALPVKVALTIHPVLQLWLHHLLNSLIVETVLRTQFLLAGSLADLIRIVALGKRVMTLLPNAPHQIFKAVTTSFVVQISVMQVSDAQSLAQVDSTGNVTSVKAVMVRYDLI